MTLKIHDTNEEITVSGRSFGSTCAALLMELDNMYDTVHPEIFVALKQFSDDGPGDFTHTDIGLPEENFTLTLTS